MKSKDNIQAEMQAAFLKLEEQLRPEVLEEIRHRGFRDAMILEYRELADALKKLIGLSDKYGMRRLMDDTDTRDYDALMAWLSVCGQRIKIIIDEAGEMDSRAMLALARPADGRIN
jgi:hypothetical protein